MRRTGPVETPRAGPCQPEPPQPGRRRPPAHPRGVHRAPTCPGPLIRRPWARPPRAQRSPRARVPLASRRRQATGIVRGRPGGWAPPDRQALPDRQAQRLPGDEQAPPACRPPEPRTHRPARGAADAAPRALWGRWDARRRWRRLFPRAVLRSGRLRCSQRFGWAPARRPARSLRRMPALRRTPADQRRAYQSRASQGRTARHDVRLRLRSPRGSQRWTLVRPMRLDGDDLRHRPCPHPVRTRASRPGRPGQPCNHSRRAALPAGGPDGSPANPGDGIRPARADDRRAGRFASFTREHLGTHQSDHRRHNACPTSGSGRGGCVRPDRRSRRSGAPTVTDAIGRDNPAAALSATSGPARSAPHARRPATASHRSGGVEQAHRIPAGRPRSTPG
ncbi:hypothetical protein UG55_102258 [Frankia sp. EI5c]|nr:hypothetical protein UG55_102258 [Frankia sp. EI5c]